jgi:hypothetical protein
MELKRNPFNRDDDMRKKSIKKIIYNMNKIAKTGKFLEEIKLDEFGFKAEF